jgi:hypothetical protein
MTIVRAEPMGVRAVHGNRAPKFQGPRRLSSHRATTDWRCQVPSALRTIVAAGYDVTAVLPT